MNKFRFTIKLLAIAIFMFAFASMAQAQATRTWVSGVGDDVNPCSRTAPCKTFAGAISKTATNGEIDCLDPGGFGAVTITKGITIDGTTGAGFGSILAVGSNGVIVNDTTGVGVVILRNLSINGASNGTGNGVRFLAGKSLTVENCYIFGFTGSSTNGRGIDVSLATNNNSVLVRNTSIQNCTVGIRITTSFAGGVLGAVIDNVHMENPTATVASGIELQAGAIATIRDSVIANYGTGVNITGATPARATLLRTTVLNCTTGVAVGATTFRASASSLVLNTTAVSLSGGIFRSGCDNFIDGNTTDVSGGGITNACVK